MRGKLGLLVIIKQIALQKRAFAFTNHFCFLKPPYWPSQRSLHNAPIFRLLLKVAVNGTHQCDFTNFCGALGSQQALSRCLCVTRQAWL